MKQRQNGWINMSSKTTALAICGLILGASGLTFSLINWITRAPQPVLIFVEDYGYYYSNPTVTNIPISTFNRTIEVEEGDLVSIYYKGIVTLSPNSGGQSMLVIGIELDSDVVATGWSETNSSNEKISTSIALVYSTYNLTGSHRVSIYLHGTNQNNSISYQAMSIQIFKT